MPTPLIGPGRSRGLSENARERGPLLEVSSLSLVPRIGQLYRQLGITDLVSEEDLNSGLAQLEAELIAIAAEVNVARSRRIKLRHAVRDEVNFPHLHRAHATIDDILEMSLPAELQAWVRRVHSMPMPPLVEDIRTKLAHLAASEANPMAACAARFLLFEDARASLRLATWRTRGAFEAVGADQALVDEVAEDEVDELIEIVTALPADVRPFQQLLCKAMIELTSVIDELRDALRTTKRELVEKLAERAAIEVQLRQLEPVEAVLVRNELHDVLGEQHLSVEQLQREHPALLGGLSRAALDQRASRLRRRLKERGSSAAPLRESPSLYQFLSTLEGEEV